MIAATLDRPHVWRPGTAPALLLLHGTGDDEHGLLGLGERLAPAAALLSPRGAVLEGTMPRFFRRLRGGVFDEDDLRERVDELAAFLAVASSSYGLEPGSLVAVGFSNGANTAAALLLQHPEVLAGAVLVAATTPFAAPPAADLTGRPVLVSGGERAPMASMDRTRLLVDQLRERGAEVALHTHPGGHLLAPAHLPAMQALVRPPGCDVSPDD